MARAIWTGTVSPGLVNEDGYRRRLLELITSRSGQPRDVSEPAQPVIGSGVEVLMAALEASLKQVKASNRKRRAG